MAHTYILHSESLDKFYIGACHEELGLRLESHKNSKYGSKTYTSRAKDWKLFLQFECIDYSHAVRLERKIKSMKSQKYILDLSRYPELRKKIFLETRVD